MTNLTRSDELKVNQFQINSEVQILNLLNLEFEIHLTLACLPLGMDFDIWHLKHS